MYNIDINLAANGFIVDIRDWDYDSNKYIAKTWDDVIKLVKDNPLTKKPEKSGPRTEVKTITTKYEDID